MRNKKGVKMPISDNSDGPWGSGGKKKGSSKKDNSPWGTSDDSEKSNGKSKPTSSSSAGPEIDEIVRKGQERLRVLMGGKSGGSGNNGGLGLGDGIGKGGFSLILLALVGIWLFLSLYTVKPEEKSIELLLGKYYKTGESGLNFAPWPVVTAEVLTVTRENTEDIGVGSRGVRQDEGLMLTGDENIVDIDFRIMWKISMAENFLFNLQDPEETVKVAAESVMRGIIGQTKIESALTDAKESIQSEARRKLQELVDEYGAGIEIRDVQLLSVNPPSEDVIDAFNDVQRARQERDKLINEAEAFYNDVVPRARGESAQLVAQAEAYSAEIVNRAKGDASRFNDIYKSYLMSKDVTIERIYLETFEEILGNVNKVIIDTEVSQSGVLPFLPLPELNNKNRTIRSGGN